MDITYKEIKENKDYILVGVRFDLLLLAAELEELKIHFEIEKIIFDMHHKLYEFERQEKKYIDYVAIRKDSLIGNYLITHTDGNHVINESRYIDFKKVTDAFNIATLEDNDKMVDLLLPLFKNRENGTFEELEKRYSEELLNYILEHDSLKEYLNEMDGIESSREKEYIIFENGEYSKRVLKNKTKKLKNTSLIN